MGHRILVVEDDAEFRAALTTTLLQHLPNLTEIQSTATAEEAIELLKKEESRSTRAYTLIISDIRLAGRMSGFDLWEYCRMKWPMNPYLMFSGIGHMRFLNEAGACKQTPPFLAKPARVADLMAMIDNLLAPRR